MQAGKSGPRRGRSKGLTGTNIIPLPDAVVEAFGAGFREGARHAAEVLNLDAEGRELLRLLLIRRGGDRP